MNYIKKIIVLFLLVGMAQIASAQIGDDGQTELLKPFKAKLEKSSKFESVPHLPQLDTNSNKNNKYIVPTHLMGLAYPAPVVRPLAMPKGKAEKAYPFYAKAAFGYPLSPLVELSYYHNTIKNFKFGVNARHHSLIAGYTPDDNRNFTTTHVDLSATYFTEKNIAVGAAFEFNYNTNRFYGFTDSIETIRLSPDSDSLRQRFIDIKGNVNLFNGKINKSSINYRGDVDFYSYSDAYGSSEFSISPNLTFEKGFGKSGKKHILAADIGMNYLSFKDAPVTRNLVTTTAAKDIVLFYFHPTFTINAGAFKARLGVNLGVNETKFFIHPDVELSYAIAKGALTIYLGGVGQVRQNSFRSLTYYNRFLVSNPDIRHTNYLELFGGVRGSVKKIGYGIKGGYAITQNLPYFINDLDSFSQFSRFRPVYDTTGIIFVRGTLDFKLLKNFVIGANVSFNSYQTKNFEKAFHLPTFESNFFISYDIFFTGKNKKSKGGRKESNYLSLRADLYINTGVSYLSEANTTTGLRELGLTQGLYDFSFNIRYQASKNIAVFADFNNIIHNQNQRWYLYRQIGFNGKIGIELKF